MRIPEHNVIYVYRLICLLISLIHKYPLNREQSLLGMNLTSHSIYSTLMCGLDCTSLLVTPEVRSGIIGFYGYDFLLVINCT